MVWQSNGATPCEKLRRLTRTHAAARERAPSLLAVRRALRGHTFKRSKVETRGRQQILSAANMRTLDKARKRLYVQAAGDYEVTWEDIIRAARVPMVDRTTAAKCMKAAGFYTVWCTPRSNGTDKTLASFGSVCQTSSIAVVCRRPKGKTLDSFRQACFSNRGRPEATQRPPRGHHRGHHRGHL